MKESKLLGYVENVVDLCEVVFIICVSCIFYRHNESIPMTVTAVLLVLGGSKVAAFVCIKAGTKIGTKIGRSMRAAGIK